MDARVSPDLPGDRAELAELRRRAYSADADIAADPAALARLAELEDLIRSGRQPEIADAEPIAAPAQRTPGRWHVLLVAATAAAALALGAIASTPAWTPSSTTPMAADDRADTDEGYIAPPSSAAGFAANLDRLRDAVLSGASPEFEPILARLDLDRLLPEGTYHGRSAWVGPTVDGDTCLVLSDAEGPIIRCVRSAEAAERGLSIVIRPGTGDPVDGSGSEEVYGGDARVRYSLLPAGAVTSELVVDP